MEDFISIIRTDRKREIGKYKDTGYSFIKEAEYLLVSKISVNLKSEQYEIGVQADAREIYFYLIDNGANYYFSIYDIYRLLYKKTYEMERGKRIDVVKALKKLLVRRVGQDGSDVIRTFFYKGIEYNITPFKLPDIKEKADSVMPDGASLEIRFTHLLILIAFIQEKSNAMFRRSKGNEKYVDGILRLLIVLISKEENIKLLNDLGWFWKEDRYIFDRDKVVLKDKRHKKKYYLTKKEYKDIMD